MNYDRYLEIAFAAAQKASDYLSQNFGNTKELIHKEDMHFSIEEDRKVNDIYINFLQKETPDASIYSEESEKIISDLTWIIDPIEGTSNFRVGNPFFATQLCLLQNMNVVVSVIQAPILMQRFHAVIGQGSFLNEKPIKVSSTKDLKEALVSIGKGTKEKDFEWYCKFLPKIMKRVRTYRHFGACGLEIAYTAAGMIDIYFNSGSKLYDYAPGSLIVTEAGGLTSDFNNNKWDIDHSDILVTNPFLFSNAKKLLDIKD